MPRRQATTVLAKPVAQWSRFTAPGLVLVSLCVYVATLFRVWPGWPRWPRSSPSITSDWDQLAVQLAMGAFIFCGPWIAALVRGFDASNASRATLFALVATMLTLFSWPVVASAPREGQGYISLFCSACLWGAYRLLFRGNRARSGAT